MVWGKLHAALQTTMPPALAITAKSTVVNVGQEFATECKVHAYFSKLLPGIGGFAFGCDSGTVFCTTFTSSPTEGT